jgi:hypothetical protein
MGARSISIPPSIDDRPATEWPPPRTATVRSFSRPKFTASTTSAVPEQLTVTAGRPMCIALNGSRTWPYSGSAGSIAGPLSWALSSSSASPDTSVRPLAIAAVVMPRLPPVG